MLIMNKHCEEIIMTIAEKKELLAEILDVEGADLQPTTLLTDFAEWDSLAILSFISMMDEEFGKEITGNMVKRLITVGDALALME